MLLSGDPVTHDSQLEVPEQKYNSMFMFPSSCFLMSFYGKKTGDIPEIRIFQYIKDILHCYWGIPFCNFFEHLFQILE